MERCVLRRRETENGNGASFLSQVFFTETIPYRDGYFVNRGYVRFSIRNGQYYSHVHATRLTLNCVLTCLKWMSCCSHRVHLAMLLSTCITGFAFGICVVDTIA